MQDGNDIFKTICTVKRGVDSQVLEQTIVLAVEVAREGREGRKIGTLFVIGDEQAASFFAREARKGFEIPRV